MKKINLITIFALVILNFTSTMITAQNFKPTKELLKEVAEMRKALHAIPEYSHKEKKTADLLTQYLKKDNPDFLYTNIGGYGLVAGYKGNSDGPSVMFRSDMDAIQTDDGFSHLCGHDGHMAILLGLSRILSKNRDFEGTMWLLFQPAEEVGEGAALMVPDLEKLGITFDYSFALHNNPKNPLNKIILHEGVYAAGSTGMEIHFKGTPAHAAYPDRAVSPYKAIIETADYMHQLNDDSTHFEDFILGTVVNITLGDINYGVTPGEGYLRMTLRSFVDEDLDILCNKMEEYANLKAEEYGLTTSFAYFDRFPATVNDDKTNKMLENVMKELGLDYEYASEPTRGSDDFAFFAFDSISSFFDIGNGNVGIDLHEPGYKFSDEIMETALNIYTTLIYKQRIK